MAKQQASSCVTDCWSFSCTVLLGHIEYILENTTWQLRKQDQLRLAHKKSLSIRTGIQMMFQKGKLVASIFSVIRCRAKIKLPESHPP